jgi:cyanophycinase-like exopeptidase
MSGDVYLAASAHERTLHAMVSQALASVAGRAPRIAVSYAATSPLFVGRMSHFLERAIDRAQVERFSVPGEHDPMPPAEARAIVGRADLVFLGGGDPVLGARRLVSAGADEWLRAARDRGVPCMGMSAGAIMLAAWWADWPETPPPEAPFDGGQLVRCTAVVTDLVVDCHAEEDDWSELRLVRAMLEDRLGEGATLPRFLGLPAGAGIVVSAGGAYRSVGGEPISV